MQTQQTLTSVNALIVTAEAHLAALKQLKADLTVDTTTSTVYSPQRMVPRPTGRFRYR